MRLPSSPPIANIKRELKVDERNLRMGWVGESSDREFMYVSYSNATGVSWLELGYVAGRRFYQCLFLIETTLHSISF